MRKPAKRCELCRYFETSMHTPPAFGHCNRITDAVPPTSGEAYAWDYEGYMAGLNVGVHFGCTLWTKKED